MPPSIQALLAAASTGSSRRSGRCSSARLSSGGVLARCGRRPLAGRRRGGISSQRPLARAPRARAARAVGVSRRGRLPLRPRADPRRHVRRHPEGAARGAARALRRLARRHGGEDELVGYHLEQAYRYRAELGVGRRRGLAADAGERLGAAGIRAWKRGDATAALTLLRRALALLPPQHGSRVELLRELSTALWLGGDVDAAELALSESIDVARATGNTRIEWYGHLERAARNASTHGETDELVETAERAVEVFEKLGDDLGLARAWRRLGLVAHTERRFADTAVACERALAHAVASGDEQERARVADLLCTALLFGPARVDEAIDRVEAILASAGRNVVLRAHVSTSLAGLLAMRAEFERARELYGEAGAVYEKLGLRLPRVGWTEIVASVEALAGDSQAAANALRSGYAVLDTGGQDSLRTRFATLLSFQLADDGDLQSARSFAHVAEAAAVPLDDDSTARLLAARALLVAGTTDAEQLGREAVTAAERTDNVNLQAAMHLTLARATGDPAEAARAKQLFETKGNVAGAVTTGLWSLQP